VPHQEKHSKVNAVGEITHVFGHLFVLKTGSKSMLARLTPRGLEVVGLRIGDRVALEGDQKPSEIKVSKLERKGETFAIGHGPHDNRDTKAGAEFEELHIELDGGVRKSRPVSPHDHKWQSEMECAP
jgi:hypothetical protein